MSEAVTGDGITPETYEARRTSFDSGADAYDRVRPEWPDDTLTWLLGGRDEPGDVLDLGAGTGKGTRALADLGHRVTAVEPSLGMLEVLRRGLGERNVHVVEADAEDLPLPDDAFDAVVCLQAWHWIDAHVAAPQMRRVLRDGGVFGLAWHAIDTSEAWVRELFEVTKRPEAASDGSDDEPLHVPGFEPAPPHRFTYTMRLSPSDLATQVGSWSHVAISADRWGILSDVERLGERVADDEGLVLVPHVTTCFRTRVAT